MTLKSAAFVRPINILTRRIGKHILLGAMLSGIGMHYTSPARSSSRLVRCISCCLLHSRNTHKNVSGIFSAVLSQSQVWPSYRYISSLKVIAKNSFAIVIFFILTSNRKLYGKYHQYQLINTTILLSKHSIVQFQLSLSHREQLQKLCYEFNLTRQKFVDIHISIAKVKFTNKLKRSKVKPPHM